MLMLTQRPLVLRGFWIWALFDCIATDGALCRNLPKGVWLIVVLLLPDIGSLAWLLLGRPEKAHWRPGSTDYASPRRPVGLEDHPRYSAAAGVTERKSAELDAQLERWEADKTKEREAELERREADLRNPMSRHCQKDPVTDPAGAVQNETPFSASSPSCP